MPENIHLDMYHGVVYVSASTLQRAVSPSVLEEFPSLVTMQVLPRVTDSSPAKRMMSQLLFSIRNAGMTLPYTVDKTLMHLFKWIRTHSFPVVFDKEKGALCNSA